MKAKVLDFSCPVIACKFLLNLKLPNQLGTRTYGNPVPSNMQNRPV